MNACELAPPDGSSRGPYASRLQQVSAVLNARELLVRLSDSKQTPRVPRAVRAEAKALLRSFPAAQVLRPVLEGEASLMGQRRVQLPFH